MKIYFAQKEVEVVVPVHELYALRIVPLEYIGSRVQTPLSLSLWGFHCISQQFFLQCFYDGVVRLNLRWTNTRY